MKLTLQVNKIKCLRTTSELGADEVYCAIDFYSGKKAENNLVIDENTKAVQVSEIKENVRKGTVWKPEKNTFSFDLGDADVFAFNFYLYEKDSGDYYESLTQEETKALRQGFDLSKLTFPKAPASLSEWVVPAIKLLSEVYTFVRRDDEIGAEPFAYHVEDPNIGLGKAFVLKKLFARYELVLNLALSD